MTSPLEQGNTAHQANYPPVSIILTVINEALHLRAAIKAALSSNYQGDIGWLHLSQLSRKRTLLTTKDGETESIPLEVIPPAQ